MRFVCLTLLLATSATAASFDCTKAATVVEKTVCATPRLSSLDDELATTWKAMPKRDALRDAQREWMKRRDECEDSEDCIEGQYLMRIAALRLQHRPLFAKEKAPARIIGRYSEMTEVCHPSETEDNANECSAEVENYFDVRRGKGNALIVSSELTFYMGHMCTVEDEPAEWAGDELRVAIMDAVTEAPGCVLLLRFDGDGVTPRDLAGFCREFTCGVRGGFEGTTLPKKK